MHSPSPHKTLLLLWGVAVLILIGGVILARQRQEVRQDRDRSPLNEFAAETQSQLQRLEDLYQDHLTRIGREAIPDAKETGRMGDEIAGILQISLLYPSKSGLQPSFHTVVNASPSGPVPLPTFSISSSPGIASESLVQLDESRLFSRVSGWIDEPGKPLMFSVRQTADEMAVITVSRPEVAENIGNWLWDWAEKAFEPIRVTGGPDQLRAGSEILAEVGVPSSEQPDVLLPLRSRFGSFEIASWDVRKTVVHYHSPTLVISAALATVIGLLGMIVFIAQKRDHAVAASRVSFVNRVSHELRTPLTNILLNTDLAMELAEDDPTESNRRLDLVRTEARRLGRLIENVLTFSRTEEGKMEVQTSQCVPAEIVTAAIDQFRASFERRGLTIERVDENASSAFICDADALAQIINNLLSNVEKYVPGGVVRITTRVADDALCIRVSDEGPGIPKESAERIFQPFERIHSEVSEGATGTGLGLAIARDLAIRLGGQLSLLSKEQAKGACFELRIPAPPISGNSL